MIVAVFIHSQKTEYSLRSRMKPFLLCDNEKGSSRKK